MRTRAVVFDFDGTLTNSKTSSWGRIWDKLNLSEIDEKYYNMFHSNEINYNEWLGLCFNEYKSNGVDKAFLNKIADDTKRIDDLTKTLEYLSKNGIQIFILSGGIRYIIERILKDDVSYFDGISANIFYFNGEHLDTFEPTMFNPDNKCEYMSYLLKSNTLDPKSVLFVGNGKNDESIRSTGVRTLCFNADDTDPLDKNIWDDHLESNSLFEIIKFID